MLGKEMVFGVSKSRFESWVCYLLGMLIILAKLLICLSFFSSKM